jgi:hypothetical protein
VADCQHTTQRLAEVGARMSVVLDELSLTRPAASISDCRPSARPRFLPKTRDPGGCVLPPRFRATDGLRPAHAGAEAAARPAARRRVLSIAAEPSRAIAVLGADLPLPDPDP